MALRVSIGNPFRPHLDGAKWHVQRATDPEATGERVIDPGRVGGLFVVDADKDALPAAEEVGLLIGSGLVAAAEILGDGLTLYEDSAGRFALTPAGEVVDLSRTSAIELASWRARAPGHAAVFDQAIFSTVEESAAALVRQLRGHSLLQGRIEAPALRPPSQVARRLAQRLFPRGLAAELERTARQAQVSLLCTLRQESGGLFGLRAPCALGLYLQPSPTADGAWGLFADVDVGAVDENGPLSGTLHVLVHIICGEPSRMLGPPRSVLAVRSSGDTLVGDALAKATQVATAGGGAPNKDLLLSPSSVELNGWTTQVLLRRSDRGFVGFAGGSELSLPTQPEPRWPLDLPVVLREAAALAPSYAMALMAALNPGLRSRLLTTALACTLSLLKPRYYGPLCNLSRIENGAFVPLGVDGAWVRFAPRDGCRTQFRFVAGLADRHAVSIEVVGSPTLYLAAQGGRLVPWPFADDADLRRAATFQLVRGLANPRGVSLRTREHPPRYIVASNLAGESDHGGLEVMDFHFLALESERPDAEFRESATFFLETQQKPPPQETAVLRQGERMLVGEYRRSGSGHYFLSLSESGGLAVFAGVSPHDNHGCPWVSSGGQTGFFSARLEDNGILVVAKEEARATTAQAATLALSEEIIVWRSEVHGEPGECFAAVLSSGELGIFRGSPEDPGELVWSSRRGPVHWAKRRTPVALRTPQGLLTLAGDGLPVRTDGHSLGKHQSFELWELWDERVALRALDRSFLTVNRDAHGQIRIGASTCWVTPEAIFNRVLVGGVPALQTADGHFLGEYRGELVVSDVPVPLRIIELPFTLPSLTGRAFELQTVPGNLLVTVDGRSQEDGAAVLVRPRIGFAEQVVRLLYQSCDDTYAVVAAHSAKCLGIVGGSANAGAEVVQAASNGHASQRVRILPNDDGSFTLIAQHSGLAWAPRDSSPRDGASSPVEQRGLISPSAPVRDDRSTARFRLRPVRLMNDRALALDFSGGVAPAAVVYREARGESTQLDGLLAAGNVQLVADFAGLGRSQLLCINRLVSSGPKLRLFDLATGQAPAGVVLGEDWGQYDWLNGWVDANDWYLAGDFMGLGHQQLVLMNRGGSLGRVMIADLAAGYPVQIRYWESWGQSMWLDGWQDEGDVHLAGDFLGLGYDQWLSINRGGQHGRIRISDVRGGQARTLYLENYGDSPLFNGWLDGGDVILAGDFLHRGHDQLLCCDRSGGAGGLLVASFHDKKRAPAEVLFHESFQAGSAFSSWFDAGDAQLVGDFLGLGHDQLLLVNRSQIRGGKFLVLDLARGRPLDTRPFEHWGQSRVSDGFGEMSDIILAGDFAGRGWSQALLLKRR